MFLTPLRFEQAQHRCQFDRHVPSPILVAVVVAVAFLDLGLDAEAAATLELALTDVSDEFLDELGPKGRSSLYPVLLYLQVEAPRSRLLRVLAKRRTELRAAYVRDDATPSRGQKDVSNALDTIKWSHRYEWCTPEGLSLDMAQPSTKTAVEFEHILR